jgi:hypothetical protein
MGRHELRDGTYTNGDPFNPHGAVDLNGGQRPFWLQHAQDCTRIYAIGVCQRTTNTVFVTWLDPNTGYCRHAQFASTAEALDSVQALLGPTTPLALIWDERTPDPDTPAVEEELLLIKASAPDADFPGYSNTEPSRPTT